MHPAVHRAHHCGPRPSVIRQGAFYDALHAFATGQRLSVMRRRTFLAVQHSFAAHERPCFIRQRTFIAVEHSFIARARPSFIRRRTLIAVVLPFRIDWRPPTTLPLPSEVAQPLSHGGDRPFSVAAPTLRFSRTTSSHGNEASTSCNPISPDVLRSSRQRGRTPSLGSLTSPRRNAMPVSSHRSSRRCKLPPLHIRRSSHIWKDI